jgi:hypothetical protein
MLEGTVVRERWCITTHAWLMILRIRKWLPGEEDLLRKLVGAGAGAREIAKRLKRTTRSIRRRAEILGLSWRAARLNGEAAEIERRMLPTGKRQSARRWAAQEEDTLRALASVEDIEEIARRLQRTVKAVQIRASMLQLSLRYREKSFGSR